ncbi:MAG: 50S ribosomal protein L5 [Planctomycetota bacterium]|jgi:large subunit ribosomal protein L5
MAPRLQTKYSDEIRPKLMEEFGITNVNAVPKLDKISVNMGIGKARENQKHLDEAMRDLTLITGQKAVVTRARRSIAQFHIREGYPVGCRVTLRGKRMYEFLDRLVNFAIPRIRDFRGLKDKLDGRGGYSLGLNDQTVFPEVNADKLEFTQGMTITMSMTGGRDDVSKRLLEEFGVPFRRKDQEK